MLAPPDQAQNYMHCIANKWQHSHVWFDGNTPPNKGYTEGVLINDK